MNPGNKRVFGGRAVGIRLFSLIFVAPVQVTSSNASGGGSYFVAAHTRVMGNPATSKQGTDIAIDRIRGVAS